MRIVWEIGFLYVTKNLGIVDFDKNYLAESFMKENVSGLDLIWKKKSCSINGTIVFLEDNGVIHN